MPFHFAFFFGRVKDNFAPRALPGAARRCYAAETALPFGLICSVRQQVQINIVAGMIAAIVAAGKVPALRNYEQYKT